MPTSSYMPDVTVHIAFDSGFLTPAASRTWTDVSDYVELQYNLSITFGRGDERSTADANQLTVTFINDGRFTPFKTGGAYYPNVKLDRPIRVTADPVDGGPQVEFLGFINDWGPSWEGTDACSYVTVTASSRLARLGMVAGLKSIVETAILTDAPLAYYTLGEPEGSTQANDSSGLAGDPLRVLGDGNSVIFGSATGPGTDGLTAAQFAGDIPTATTETGQYLTRGFASAASPTGWTVECFFLCSTSPTFAGSQATLVSLEGAGTVVGVSTRLALRINSSGALVGLFGIPIGTQAAATDGATHHAAATWDGTTGKFYYDGVLIATDPGMSGTVNATPTQLMAGFGLTGVVAHAAVYPSVLSAAQVLSHSSAGLTGYAGETTSARLIRYAGYAGVESAAIVAETGQTTVQHVDTTDQQPVELMRRMETTEGGVLFDYPDGTTGFHNRAHRLTTASAFTLDMAQQMVEADYAPRLDRTGLANDITAQDITGRYTAHMVDTQSRNVDNGVATKSIETASEDDDEPLFQASWALYKYKDPKMRVPTLSVNALDQVGKTPNCAAVMAATIGTLITVSNRPTQDSTSSGTFFVEGYTRTYGPESLMITFNVSPSSPEDTTYVCGDASRGVIGTNPIAL